MVQEKFLGIGVDKMSTYLVLSLLMRIFIPSIGVFIADSLNHAWGTHISGIMLWIIGLIVAIIFD